MNQLKKFCAFYLFFVKLGLQSFFGKRQIVVSFKPNFSMNIYSTI